jgi:aurora kinase, other
MPDLNRAAPRLWNLGMFEIGQPLGKGRFGCVYLARDCRSGFVCALKALYKHEVQHVKAEKLRYRNILQLYGHFQDSQRIVLILGMTTKGDLSKHLRRENRFPECKAALYVAQMATALKYMHKKHVIYRDITPENIFVGIHGEIKMSDFGSSVHTRYNDKRNTICGTLDYLPPEMIKPGSQNNYYNNAIDLWSLGILTYEFMVGEAPFEDTLAMV